MSNNYKVRSAYCNKRILPSPIMGEGAQRTEEGWEWTKVALRDAFSVVLHQQVEQRCCLGIDF